MECILFHRMIATGIYQISDLLHGPNSDGTSEKPGRPTQNSYLIIGKKEAILIDLAIEDPMLVSYAEQLAGKPIKIILTHGHPDHIYYLQQYKEAWIHEADMELVQDGMPGISDAIKDTVLHPLGNETYLDLGDHLIEVIHIPGHTKGSILLYDHKTKYLFSGDTCARRLLYGLGNTVPLRTHCDMLEVLRKKEITAIYTAHDRCSLPKAYIEKIINHIKHDLPRTNKKIFIPNIGSLYYLSIGQEDELSYFDIAVSEEYFIDIK